MPPNFSDVSDVARASETPRAAGATIDHILTPPPPRELAIALADDSLLCVKAGARVNAGDVLAQGGENSADAIAPLAGVVAGLQRRRLSSGSDAMCVILSNIPPDAMQQPPTPLPPGLSTAQLLKRAGVIGLGGGGFPAWRKWRPQLGWLIANGMESDPNSRHDAALIRANAGALTAAVNTVARAAGAAPLLALRDDAPVAPHAMIRRLPNDYAGGYEKLLIKTLLGITIPPDETPADNGIVCFNIATALAMAQAIARRQPQRFRLLTVHKDGGGDEPVALSLPFGANMGDARRAIGLAARDDDDVVIAARETVLYLHNTDTPAAATKQPTAVIKQSPALPCIRCGACDAVCPAQLSPQRLYRAALDDNLPALTADNISHCISCRRCDEACPSNIPLTALLDAGKARLAADASAREIRATHRRRFERHEWRAAQPERKIGKDALRRFVGRYAQRAAGAGDTPPPRKV